MSPINRYSYRALFLLAFTLPFAPVDAARAAARSQPPTVTLPDLVARIKPSVVTVLVYKGEGDEPVSQGTGWFLSPTEIVTNRHVLEAGTRADIRLSTGEKVRVTGVLAETSDQDLVILAVEVKGKPPKPIPLASTGPSEGARVFSIGSPLGLDLTVSEGIVSAVRNIAPYGTIIQTTAATSPGSSGSPLMDMQGRAVGVVTLQYSRGQALNFAIAAGAVRSLQKTKVDTPSKWLASPVKSPVDTAFDLGLAAYLQWDYAEAVRQFRKAVEKHPSDPTLHYNLGKAYDQLGRGKEAIDAYKQAIRIKPDFAWAHFSLGFAYGKLGRWQQSIDACKQAIRIIPDDAEAHYYLGFAYHELGRTQEAIDAIKQAIRIRPDLAEAHSVLGVAYGDLGRWQQSIHACKQAIRIMPDCPEAHYNLGRAYLNLGRTQEAIDAYKQAIRIKPDLAEAHLVLGVAYGELGRTQEAIDAYKQAIRINPDDADAHVGLGIAYGNLGRWEEKIDAYKQAIRINPDDAEAHFSLGVAYLLVDNKGAALDVYKVLKELDPELANELFTAIYP